MGIVKFAELRKKIHARECDGNFSKQFCVHTGKKSRVRVNLITDVRATTSFAFATDHCFYSECNTRKCSKPPETTITFPFDFRIKKSKKKKLG